MPWIVKNDKEFEWVGKWATQQVADRGLRWMLVGFESPSGAMPVEGGQVVVDGVSAGRVTSRAALGRARQGDRPRDRPARARGRGRRGSSSRSTGGRWRCASTSGRSSILRASGSRHERRARLPLAVARPGRGRLPPRGALRGRAALPRCGRDVRGARRLARPRPACRARPSISPRVGIADLSHLGKLDVRPAPPADLEGDGVTTYRLSPRRALVALPAVGARGRRGAGRRRRARPRHDRRLHGARARPGPRRARSSPG